MQLKKATITTHDGATYPKGALVVATTEDAG